MRFSPPLKRGLDGDELRRDPLVVRKATLASVLARAAAALALQRGTSGRMACSCYRTLPASSGFRGGASCLSATTHATGHSPDLIKNEAGGEAKENNPEGDGL